MPTPTCSRCTRLATLDVRLVGGRPVAACTRCAGSVLLEVARAHGALVRVLPRRARSKDTAGRFVARAPTGTGVR